MPNQVPQVIPDTPMKTHLHGLDHLRTLAIALVFLFHYGHLFPHPDWTYKLGAFGWTGVDLFFVLSGYLIASQLFTRITEPRRKWLKEFFLKRVFRILPAYFTVVAIYFLFPYVHERESLAPLWKYLTFTQNLALDLRTQGTFSHAWSLCVEEHFYLLLPVLLATLLYFKWMKHAGWLLLVFFLAGFCIRIYCYEILVQPQQASGLFGLYWYKWIYYPTFCRLDGLLAGVSIAALLHYRPRIGARMLGYGNWLFLWSLLVFALGFWQCSEEESFAASVLGFPLISIGYGLIVLGAVSPASILSKWKSGVTARIAAWSYAVYLLHKIVIHLTQEGMSGLGVDSESNWVLLVSVVTVLIGAWLLHMLVERPFMKLRNRFIPSRNRQRAKATAAQ